MFFNRLILFELFTVYYSLTKTFNNILAYKNIKDQEKHTFYTVYYKVMVKKTQIEKSIYQTLLILQTQNINKQLSKNYS